MTERKYRSLHQHNLHGSEKPGDDGLTGRHCGDFYENGHLRSGRSARYSAPEECYYDVPNNEHFTEEDFEKMMQNPAYGLAPPPAEGRYTPPSNVKRVKAQKLTLRGDDGSVVARYLKPVD